MTIACLVVLGYCFVHVIKKSLIDTICIYILVYLRYEPSRKQANTYSSEYFLVLCYSSLLVIK